MKLSKAQLSVYKSLSGTKGRAKHSKFLISGVRAIKEAIEAGIRTETIVVAVDALSDYGHDFLMTLKNSKLEITEASPSEIARIDDSRTSQGMIAVSNLDSFPAPDHVVSASRVLVLDRISDPSNLGAILRSALAFGFEDIILGSGTADPLSPKVIRSSTGNLFHLRLHRDKEIAGLTGELKGSGYLVVGMDTRGESGVNLKRDSKIALIIGNEAHGISAEIISQCDRLMRIPINSKCESLSAPIAASIAMFIFSDIKQ